MKTGAKNMKGRRVGHKDESKRLLSVEIERIGTRTIE